MKPRGTTTCSSVSCEPGKENGIKDMKSKDLSYAHFTSADTNEGLDKWELLFS